MANHDELLGRFPRDRFWSLPAPDTQKGQARRTGVEIEFADLDESAAAAIVQAHWGGTLNKASAHEMTVAETELGDVRIELDLFLRDRAGDAMADMLLDWSRQVVPVEIITAPLRVDQMPQVEDLLTALVEAGASGSQDGILYGFGLHLNPEVSGETAEAILPVVRAYALLEDWLRAIDPVDPSRRLLPFVDPWPDALVDRLAREGAEWDLDDLVRAYADLTPTRNRGLDLLPLLEHLRPDLLAASMDADQLKGGRPTYHYRLPEARLGADGWSLAYEWNRWVLVERVAADTAVLEELAQAWCKHRDTVAILRGDWAATVGAHLAKAAIWS